MKSKRPVKSRRCKRGEKRVQMNFDFFEKCLSRKPAWKLGIETRKHRSLGANYFAPILTETAYSRRTPTDRLAELVARDLRELVDATARRVEQMTSSLLFSGAFSYKLDDGSTETLSYGSVVPVVPATLWDAVSGSDPLKDLTAAVDAIIASSGLIPDTVVFGADTLSAFLANDSVATQLNRLHLVVGSIQPSAPLGSEQFIGTLYRPHVKLFSYSETFEDEVDNSLKPMIEPDTVLVGCSNSPALTAYGSVTQVEQSGETSTYQDLRYVPRRLSEPREDRVSIRITSRPCLIPYDTESWRVLKPLGAVVGRRSERSERRESK